MSRQKKLTFLHRRLLAGLGRVSLHHGKPRLFRRRRATRRPDADRQCLRPACRRRCRFSSPCTAARRMARGDRTANGFDQAVAAARAVAVTPPVITVAATGETAVVFKELAVRLPNGAAAGKCQRSLNRARRARAGQRAIRRRQVDAIPGDRRHLAVRCRHNHSAEKRPDDDAAAAALFSDRAAWRPRSPIRRSRAASMRPRSPS